MAKTKTLEKLVRTPQITLPVQECLSGPWPVVANSFERWKHFERLVCDCWHHATSLANWASHTIRAHDVVRDGAMKELPRFKKIDLYALAFGRAQEGITRLRLACPECGRKFAPHQCEGGLAPGHKRGRNECVGVGRATTEVPRGVLPVTQACYPGGEFWDGAKVAAATLLRRVLGDYLRWRPQIVWRRERRSPEYLYPYPYPVHQQQWAPYLLDQGRLAISLALPGGRVALRLRNGPEFDHAVRVFKQIVAGDLKQLELKLDAESSRAHCRLINDLRPGDDRQGKLRLLLRIAYHEEYYAPTGKGHTAVLKTGRNPFLKMTIPGREQPWVLHAPWAQEWIVEHRLFLNRFADDMKFEKRWPRKARRRRNKRQSRACDLHENRMRSFRQETAEQVVGFAVRTGCGRIHYDDSDHSWGGDDFSYFNFAKEIESTCQEQGVVYTHFASGETATESNGVATELIP